MGGTIVIFLIILAISAMIGAVSNWLKNIQKAEQQRAEQTRASRRSERAPVSEVDRFLEEIDKLRRKNSEKDRSPSEDWRRTIRPDPPAAKRVPPAASPPPRRPLEAPPAPVQPSRVQATRAVPVARGGLDSLPEAPVIAQPASIGTPGSATATSAAHVVKAGAERHVGSFREKSAPKTDFARELATLLTSKQSIPMAIVLTEIFGKPKSKQ